MDATETKNSSAFGNNVTQYTGRDAETRIIFVPTNATGYDADSWNNSIFSLDRKVVNGDGSIKEYYYTLSKTL